MGFFSGKYNYSVDEKGRINFKKFLNRLDETEKGNGVFHLLKQTVEVYGSKEIFPVFYIFTDQKWDLFYEDLEIGKSTAETSAFTTQFCDESTLDNMERISFPKDFLKYIGANKNLFLQGFGDKLQVWSQENFDKYSKMLSECAPMKDFFDILGKKKKIDH